VKDALLLIAVARSVTALALVTLGLLAAPGIAAAGEVGSLPTEEVPLRLLRQAREGTRLSAQPTDPAAAQELPHRDLDRAEAIELTESVFGPQLSETQGIFGGLDVKKYLSENSAIVSSEAKPEAVLRVGGGSEAGTGSDHRENDLLESTLPLETEGPLGGPIPVDLSLDQAGSGLVPAVPLVEVELPKELGEGIELPESEIGIELVGHRKDARPRSSMKTSHLPERRRRHGLLSRPTPTGLETFSTIRSAESPDSETLRFDLPVADILSQDEAGAVVTREGRKVLSIPPPTATDADGAAVPVSLSVEGDSLTLSAHPDPGATFPILLDPIVESYDWFDYVATTGQGTWHFQDNEPGFSHSYPGTDPYGIWILAPSGSYYPGDQAGWYYYVPRLMEEHEHGRTPTSYIVRMSLMHVGFHTSPGPYYSPYETMGILGEGHWAGVPGHEAVWGYGGNYPAFYAIPNYPGYPGWGINFENGEPGKRDQTAKVGLGLALASVENAYLPPENGRIAELGGAAVEVADEDAPKVANGSISPWMNQTATAAITAEAADTGLGVKVIGFELPGGQGSRTYVNPCTGAVESPCPENWTASVKASEYNPSSMPQGIDEVKLGAQDALWNTAAAGEKALVRIDHTPPILALSGTLTEQATRGTTLPQYKLRYVATDGAEGSPQAGVVSTELKLDGKAVEPKYAPGCATRNCSITREWTLTASNYTAASHTIEVIATDGVGLTTTRTLKFGLTKDTTAPSVTASGGFFEGPSGWLTQKNYSAQVVAKDAQGAGVTALALKVDGKTIKAINVSCSAGACEASISTTLNMASYEGGEHSAEVVATDGAGNTTTKRWTIDLDPSGTIPSREATRTLEAVEGTEPETSALASADEVIPAEEREQGNNPGIEVIGEGEYITSGVPVESTVVMGANEALTLNGSEAEFEITPVASGSSASAEVVEGISAVLPSTNQGADTVIRPKYNGLLDFQDIREAASLETFEWEVSLLPGESLRGLEGGQSVAVYFEEEIELMLISAMPAHDVLGKGVPTHLSVSGPNAVKLTVEHRGGSYVYPVTAGPSFEVGYSSVEVIKPVLPPEAGESEVELGELWVSAPEPSSPQAAGITDPSILLLATGKTTHEHIVWIQCEVIDNDYGDLPPGFFGRLNNSHCGNPFTRSPGPPEIAFNYGLKADYWISPGVFAKHLGSQTEHVECAKMYDEEHLEAQEGWAQSQFFINPASECRWRGASQYGEPSYAPYGKHITAYGLWEWGSGGGRGPGTWLNHSAPLALYIWASKDRYVGRHKTECIDC
jgi:hypothetical protein